jgi:hypothetical protein
MMRRLLKSVFSPASVSQQARDRQSARSLSIPTSEPQPERNRKVISAQEAYRNDVYATGWLFSRLSKYHPGNPGAK